MAHVTAGTCHDCQLYRVPVFVSEISFFGWIVFVRQDGHVSLVPHTTAFKSPLVLTRMSPRFSLCIVVFRSVGMPYLCGLTVPQQQIVFRTKSSDRSEEENKLFMQFVTISLYSSRHICHCVMGCCQLLSPAVCPYPGTHPCHTYNQWSRVVCKFLCQNICICFGMYCLKITLPLNFTVTSSTAKCSGG